MTKPLLLLAAPSRESRDKAAHLAAAARDLGVAARIHIADSADHLLAQLGGMPCIFALPCSDAHAVAATSLNEQNGNKGLSPGLMTLLADKATAIPRLGEILGLPLLPQCLPRMPEDIAQWSWPGPIFVKPTQSSGGWSPRPWGYRQFADKNAFMRWIRDENLEAGFFAEQQNPATLGPALLQAALDGGCTEGAILLLAPSRTYALPHSYCYFESGGTDGPRWRRCLYQDSLIPELPDGLLRLDRLRGLDPAWGRGLLHIQGIRSPAGLHLIDVNLRLTTTWDCMAATTDPTTHRRLLASLLFDEPFDTALPAPAIAIDLVNGQRGRRIQSIDHPVLPPHILPVRLSAEALGSPVAGFDKAGVMPSFVTLADDRQTCIARAEAFRAGIRLHYATENAA